MYGVVANVGLFRAAFLFNSSKATTQMKTNFFSWDNVSYLLNALPCEVCKCETIDDAKGYIKVLVILFIAFIMAGIGGAA